MTIKNWFLLWVLLSVVLALAVIPLIAASGDSRSWQGRVFFGGLAYLSVIAWCVTVTLAASA
ncbi:hypothetical protein PP501_gp53 [Gordonia phage Powerball]|uniref:Uncharacterized protein n=1 Tax=Gordonia phage Powerball TaxID=2599847 RepID=A0A5J6TRN2_9CAUD|nr:hypothetical protein PP501_gp53 [Gordonia phage Powerball]QFG13485.1 hypothetical protein PBI_POWERBALL_53 [Gordonia phage Powerball]